MNANEPMFKCLSCTTRRLLSAAMLGWLASAASATTTTYGTGQASTAYEGGTINAGDTVQLDDGATVSGGIVNNGTLDFNQSAGTLTISGTVTGNGTLKLSNSGTLQLSGTQPSTRFIPLNMTINANKGFLITPIVNGTQNGILQLGQSGTGTLNVAGGYVTSNNLLVGQGNGEGTINVSSGTLSPVAFLTLGGTGGGSGTLNVTGGLVGGSAPTNMGNGIFLGRSGSSSGLITVTGGTVSTLADLRIGEIGSGTVSITNGYFRANNTNVGSGTTSVGLLTCTSGTADMRGFLILGGTSSGAGRGTLTVDGSVVAVRGGTLGAQAGTLGTVTVTSGTWLNNANGIGGAQTATLMIGGTGTGTGTGSVTINNGGYVVVSGTLSRGANGTLTLNQGGTLQIGGISDNSNDNRFVVAATGTVGSGTSGVLVGDLDFAGRLKFAQNNLNGTPTSTHNGRLSGAGDLVKTGTGTLLIGGSNSYTGGTTLVAGVVSLNSPNAVGTTGTISFEGGTLQATSNNTTDYSARFSNAANQKYAVDSNGENLTLASDLTSVGGTFTKAGAGTVTLTGANTFTSGTIQGGLLQGSAQNLATSGTFGIGGLTELRFNQTTNDSWSGKLFGTGTASKYGAGTLTLSGSGGSNTGTLSIVEGAVRVSTDSIKRNVDNNSQLTFDQTTTGTYASNISGTGSLGVVGSGTITFSGTNSFSGTATVSSGRLVATRVAAMPSLVVNNSSVSFSIGTTAISGTYAGVMTGAGSLTKLGPGSVTLTGANTFSGGTTVSAGSLIGDTTSLQGNITNDAAVTFDQAGSGTYAGAMSGAGSLTKLGGGTVILGNTNAYSGATTVSGGVLALVGGSHASAITVNDGASLGFTLGSGISSNQTVTFSAGSTVTITGTPTLPSYTLMTTSATFTGIAPVLSAPIAGYELKVEASNTLKLAKLGYGAWAPLNGAGVNLGDDHDGDGVTNGVEYFLGGPAGDTTGFTALPGVVKNAGTLSVTWPKGAGYAGAYATDFVVETSATLSGPWTAETIGGGNLTDIANPGGSVKYTFPGGPAYSGKNFARLRVTGP